MNLRKACCLISLLFISSMLFASSWSVGASLGTRYRSTAPDLFYYFLSASYENLDFAFSGIGNDDIAADLRYDLSLGKTIHNEFIFHTDYTPGEGGYSSLGYLFSQQFRFSWFLLRYGIGVQGAVSYTPFADKPFYSLIPLLDLAIGFDIAPVSFIIYGTNASPDTSEWKLMLSFGTRCEVEISDEHLLFADGFIAIDNIMDMSDFTLSGWGVKLGYAYRESV